MGMGIREGVEFCKETNFDNFVVNRVFKKFFSIVSHAL